MVDLTNPIYSDDDKAREHLEALRWDGKPYCPHCGEVEAITKLAGKSTRPGVYKCRSCRKPFSVTVGTLFERSHISLPKWLLATHLMAASKKGISSHQLARMLGVTYKSAWFMSHRIRAAMAPSPEQSGPVGGPGKTVEADETYLNRSRKTKRKVRANSKGGEQVLSLVERGGHVRSVYLDGKSIREALKEHLHKESRLSTDRNKAYMGQSAQHGAVDHSKYQWVKDDIHTNTLEGFFSLFKRGLSGIYQHVDKKHLDRYLAEFDFRMNHRAKLGFSDAERADKFIEGIEGKRLTYRRTGVGAKAEVS